MRLAAFALIFAAGNNVQQPAAHPSPDLTGIAHVALRVANLDASVLFYQKLGFTRAFELSRDGKVYESFIKINDRQFLELYPVTAKDAQVGFLHLCFEGADLQAAHDFYAAEALPATPVRTAGAGNLLFTMPGPLTPTGPQNLEYTQYMPGSLHSRDFGQHTAPDPISRQLTDVTIAVDDLAAANAFYIDKLHFIPVGTAGTATLILPGQPPSNRVQGIRLASAETLHHSSRITFHAAGNATRYLHTHAIPYTPDRTGGLLITDPDGNQIVLEPARP